MKSNVRAILGWVVAATLCLVYSLVLTAYTSVLFLHDKTILLVPLIFVGLLAIFIGCCSGVSRFCRKRGWDSRCYWRSALLLLFALPIAWLTHDAPPIDHDYTISDIVSHDPKVLESYDTLMLFRKEGGLKIDPVITNSNYQALLTNPLLYSNLIARAWDSIAEARSILDKLDTYAGIADLTPQSQLATNTPFLNYATLRSVGWTYAAYASLKTAEGQPEEAARNLAKFEGVVRKALPHSSILISKMIWISLANNNVEAAFRIVKQTNCAPEALRLLKTAFQPLSEEDVSLRRVIIGEYVWQKYYCTEYPWTPDNFLDAFMMGRGVWTSPSQVLHRVGSRLLYYTYRVAFRKNRTLRNLRQNCDLLVAGAAKRPPDDSAAKAFAEKYSARPDLRNTGGWFMFNISVPSFTRVFQTGTKTKVLSDLLYLEIEKRLGEKVVMQDYCSGKPYMLDEKTDLMFSVGPDGIPHTADDITLGETQTPQKQVSQSPPQCRKN